MTQPAKAELETPSGVACSDLLGLAKYFITRVAQQNNPFVILPICISVFDTEKAHRAMVVVPHTFHKVKHRTVIRLTMIILRHSITVHRLLSNHGWPR